MLQRLQVCRCISLAGIPEDFGNICMLEWIELSGCNDSVICSVRDPQKEQECNGNDWLKIFLNPGVTKQRHKRTGQDARFFLFVKFSREYVKVCFPFLMKYIRIFICSSVSYSCS